MKNKSYTRILRQAQDERTDKNNSFNIIKTNINLIIINIKSTQIATPSKALHITCKLIKMYPNSTLQKKRKQKLKINNKPARPAVSDEALCIVWKLVEGYEPNKIEYEKIK
jgi:hypothetical protein